MLAPAIFTYIATGNVDDCLPDCRVEMVPETEARATIEEVNCELIFFIVQLKVALEQ